MPLLEVCNLSVSLGKNHAVRNVSFHVDAGESVAIVGESGCGKSTTALSVMRLIPPSCIQAHHISFQGDNLLEKSKKEMEKIRGKHMSMIFQDPTASLNPTMAIGKQITECLYKHQKISKKAAHLQAIDLLHQVGITEPKRRFKQYPHEFSGGMCQRVVIAIALCCHPSLIIADEPTTSLDVTIQSQILDLIQTIQKKTQTSLVLITHDLGIIARTCDRILVMYGGEIVETGTVNEIFYSPQHPYTQALLDSIPRLDMEKSQRLFSIPGSPPHGISLSLGCPFYERCHKKKPVCKKQSPPAIQKTKSQQVRCWECL